MEVSARLRDSSDQLWRTEARLDECASELRMLTRSDVSELADELGKRQFSAEKAESLCEDAMARCGVMEQRVFCLEEMYRESESAAQAEDANERARAASQ